MNKIHTLKIEDHYLERLLDGSKTYELRINDRDYQVGDIVQFYQPNLPDGMFPMSVIVDSQWEITHVLAGGTVKGLLDDYCVLSLMKFTKTNNQ